MAVIGSDQAAPEMSLKALFSVNGSHPRLRYTQALTT